MVGRSRWSADIFAPRKPPASSQSSGAFLGPLLGLLLAVVPTVNAVAAAVPSGGIHTIKHVIVIMQENRSFDSYFGTFPGADGIPMQNGAPTVCVPDPQSGQCVQPHHDPNDQNGGGPHGQANASADINGGKMDGFIKQAEGASKGCSDPNNPVCKHGSTVDVMGYHDAREIPNYWQYAQQFVLQDKLFEPNASWSLPAHLFTVSGWSAKCATSDPMSCHDALQAPDLPPDFQSALRRRVGLPVKDPNYAWTDLTYLLHAANLPWAYYVEGGTEPDCANDAMTCAPVKQNAKTPGIWNPLPWFETVKQDGQLGNITDVSNYFTAAKEGTLPAVSWITPSGPDSEHPPALVSKGQAWTTNLINAAMQGPDWNSTAIFLTWDDWGGFYDHVTPPTVIRTATACAFPVWSSHLMPGKGTLTTRRSVSTPT